MTEKEFFKYLKESCNIVLTDAQREAVVTISGPVALISCPGSGKTTVLVTKIAYIILCKNVDPSRILVTSFSKQSAQDMEDRFCSKFGDKVLEKVNFSTMHSFAFSVFRDYAYKVNMKYSIIEGTDSKITTKNSLLSSFYKKYNSENITEDKLKELSGFISYIKNLMILYKDIDIYADQFPVPNFKEIYKDYEDAKREYTENISNEKIRLLDFDDMLSMCYFALNKNPKLLEEYRASYDYFMIDEAQDTSKIQNAISKLISYPTYNLCIVGDHRQSIYSWRGAVVDELTNFKKNYPNAKMLFMDENFRSTKSIVNVSSEFIKKNNQGLNRDMFTFNETGEPIEFISTLNELNETEYVISILKKEKNLRENAIIYRNNISAIPIIEALTQEDIPFYIKDEIPTFFNHWITKDIINFFDFAENLWCIEYFETIYYKIRSYVQKKDVQALYLEISNINDSARKITVFDMLLQNPNYESKKKHLLAFRDKFKELYKMKPKAAIEYIEIELNYRAYLKEYAKKFNYSMESIDVMLASLKAIANNLTSLSEFKDKLGELKTEMIKSKKNKEINAVTLITAHGAKGLEWDQVLIIQTQNLPSRDSIEKSKAGDGSALSEEARLMFVAITRARKKLHLLYPLEQNGQKVVPSPFFNKLEKISNPHKKVEKNIPKNKFKLVEGMLICHKKWGKVEIEQVDGDIISVKLNEGSIKKLSAIVCFNKNLIEPI
jgi:DNA helicase II / ATP-dependent DNA helicase PcrA